MSKQNNKQYFIHNGTKIIISEHFNEHGKSLEDVIKDAISREAKSISTKEPITSEKQM